MENENNQIVQKSAIGSQTTQIGVQNIINGISPEDASKMAIDLFMENFPKLQSLAAETARERAEEFCTAAIEKLKAENVQDFSAFGDPDVQYVLYQAQRDYARMGTKELLDQLTSLLSLRVTHDQDFVLKATIDKAMEIAPYLLPRHYDLLVAYFIVKHMRVSPIKTISDLQARLSIESAPFTRACKKDSQYLDTHGCLQIYLGGAAEMLAKSYGFPKNEVERVCPPVLKEIDGDYGLSYVGKMLAISHYCLKKGFKLDPHIWIK